MTTASEAVGITRKTAYDARQRGPLFDAQCKESQALSIEYLEKEAFRRASEGWMEPVFHKGEVVGHIRKFSDTLLIFLMKGNAPHKYRENVNVKHQGGIDITAPEKFVIQVLAPLALGVTEAAAAMLQDGSGESNGVDDSDE